MKNLVVLLLVIVLSACQTQIDLGKAADEVYKAEADFATAAAQKGVAAAFHEFADEGAVINRGGLIKGRQAIRAFYDPIDKAGVKFTWKPDTVIVASGGDLAYTYGSYQHHTKDSVGNPIVTSGIFHTIWRKQPDGSWKYVWD
jgi:ketosteroid isomerase-like protein